MEIWIIVISIIAVLGMLGALIFKSEIHFKHFTLHTFYVVPLVCAIILLATTLVKWDDLYVFFTKSDSINPLQILVLFFSMAFISIVLDEAGFFTYLASKVVSIAHGSQFVVFTLLYVLTSLLTIFTSNDIIILTFTPFLIYFAKEAKINPIPYLVSEFVAANTWSILFIIGNPTNIYLGESFHITFIDYFVKMWPCALLAGLSSFAIMVLLFYKKLRVNFTSSNDIQPIKDKPLMIASLSCLSICLILMVISNFLHISLWLISACSALALLLFSSIYILFKRQKANLYIDSFKRLPYSIVPFILSMFVIVLALKSSGVTSSIGNVLNQIDPIWSYGLSSFASADLLNNIPMSVLYSEIINDSGANLNAVYASIIGSNIGAFLTPVGALAGVMWMSILKEHEIKFTFLDFVKYCSLIALPTMAISLLGLYF